MKKKIDECMKNENCKNCPLNNGSDLFYCDLEKLEGGDEKW